MTILGFSKAKKQLNKWTDTNPIYKMIKIFNNIDIFNPDGFNQSFIKEEPVNFIEDEELIFNMKYFDDLYQDELQRKRVLNIFPP